MQDGPFRTRLSCTFEKIHRNPDGGISLDQERPRLRRTLAAFFGPLRLAGELPLGG